eukprot:Awhi_evm1s13794
MYADVIQVIQMMIIETGQQNGQAEIEKTIKAIFRGDQQLSEIQAELKFQEKWTMVIEGMVAHAQIDDSKKKIFEIMKQVYTGRQYFPLHLLNNHTLEQRLMNEDNNEYIMDFLSNIFRNMTTLLTPLQSSDATFQNITTLFAQKFETAKNYLNLKDFFNLVCVGDFVNLARFPQAVNWVALKNEIWEILRTGPDNDKARKELFEIFSIFPLFGWEVHTDFVESLLEAAKKYNLRIYDFRFKEFQSLLNQYNCFSDCRNNVSKTYPLNFCSGKKENFQTSVFADMKNKLLVDFDLLVTKNEVPFNDQTNFALIEDTVQYRLVVKDENMPQNYKNCLQILLEPNNPSLAFQDKKVSLKDLKTVVRGTLENKWKTILSDLGDAIYQDIVLPNEVQAISSFSVSLVNIIQTKVALFIRNNVNNCLNPFGLTLDMDGKALLHYYALVYTWQLLVTGLKKKSLRSVEKMRGEEQNWRSYFISTVCSDAHVVSVEAGKRTLSTLIERSIQEKHKEISVTINNKLNVEKASFHSKEIQKELDQNLLFSERAEELCVIQYLTHQTEYVEKAFEQKFRNSFGQMKEELLGEAKRNLNQTMQILAEAITELAEGLNKHSQEKQSHFLFQDDNCQYVYEIDKAASNKRAYEFFVAFLKGDISNYPQFSNITPRHTIKIIDLAEPFESGIPFLHIFCSTLLEEISKMKENISWKFLDSGIEKIYNDFKNTSIGCPEMCPTCGRKCDASPTQ